MSLPLLRGTTDGADCENCPFSRDGKPHNAVVSEYPEDPAFLVVGEGPGRNEVLWRRPFVGESGKILDKAIAATGRKREEVGILNSTLCFPTKDDVAIKEQAGKACHRRLMKELARFPGKPILTLGAVAARAIIPKEVLDAIDPPEVAPSHKRKQKDKQAALHKAEQVKAKKLAKLKDDRFVQLINQFIDDKAGEPWRRELKKRVEEEFKTAKASKGEKLSKATNTHNKEVRNKRFQAIVNFLYENYNDVYTEIKTKVDKEFENAKLEDIQKKLKEEKEDKKQLSFFDNSFETTLNNNILAAGKDGEKLAAIKKRLEKEDPKLLKRFVKEADEEAKKLQFNALEDKERGLRLAAEAEEKAKQAKKKSKKKVGISDIAGTVFKVTIADGTGIERVVIPAVHPAAILRGGGKAILGSHTPDLAFWNIVSDAAKVNAIAQGKDIFLDFPIHVEYEDKDKAADLFYEFYRRAIDGGSFALDLETYVDDPDRHHALQAYVAKIRAIGLATNDWSMSVLWELLPSWALALLKYLLLSEKYTIILHNGLYDRTVLAANGFPSAGPWEDTLLQHHSTFPGAAHNLQSVTAQFYGVTPWKSEFRNNAETPEKLVRYCARDTYATRKDENALTVWIKRTNTERCYDLDKKMSACATGMHLDGVPVSREENDALLSQFITARDESKQRVEEMAEDPKTIELIWHHLALEQARKQRKSDPEMFSERHKLRVGEMKEKFDRGKWWWKVSANQHVAALLRAKGVQLTELTPTGATKVNKEILESLVEVPIVRDVLKYRENDKLISTFVWPLFDRHLKDGGISYGFADENDRVHPIWNVHRISGRWSSGDPVVSNIPKSKIKKMPDGSKKVLRPNIRKQYVARKHRLFVGFDYGQLEARILALLSKDEWLCNVFATGLDIHREAARIIWPEFDSCNESIQKQLRDNAKPFEYGAFYGADPETLYKALIKEGYAIERADVYKAYHTLMDRLHGVARYQTNIFEFASKPPFTLTSFLWGRRRVFPLGQVDRNETLNWPIQTAAADIMNFGMSLMVDRLMKYRNAYPVLQIHDAAVFECWEEDAQPIAKDVDDCFAQEHCIDGVTVPFPVDIKISNCWAEL